ncbi:hypothetical protein AQJ43_16400 [Streptomyces avermitilis]|nr:hypothetical protein AQJ43_16400 [Streptomyces avermitilis]
MAKQNRQMPEHGADQGCLLDNRHAEAGIRFDALSELFDPVTFRHVDQLGIGAGMRCRKIGAGGPSVPLGPAERFGPSDGDRHRHSMPTDSPRRTAASQRDSAAELVAGCGNDGRTLRTRAGGTIVVRPARSPPEDHP